MSDAKIQPKQVTPRHIYIAAGVVVAALVGIFILKPLFEPMWDSNYTARELAAFEWCKDNVSTGVNRMSKDSRDYCLFFYSQRR